MRDFLENIANQNGWIFDYGRSDFLNLFDQETEGKTVFLLDPLTSTDILGESGTVDGISWSGSFLLGKSSSFNEKDYKTRYDEYIKPALNIDLDAIRKAIRCSNSFTLKSVSTTEIINSDFLDFNFDGLLVRFTIEEDK